jgi:leucyl-tRNA synthetase
MGGGEHAVLHLLYARFWHKVLYDYGYVTTLEPFKRLFHQGLIMGEDGRKMSKSLGNVVNPDEVIAAHGADALRLYEMFLGPLEATKPWSTTGIEGVTRFLNRSWRMIATEDSTLAPAVQDVPCPPELERVLHATIKKTREDVDALSFNTAIAQFMIFVNEFTKLEVRPRVAMVQYVQCLAPFAPHIAEELWHILGEAESVHTSIFPEYDASKLVLNEVEIVVQVSSKIRGKLVVSTDADASTIESMARQDAGILKHLEGREIVKVITVPNKLINFIVK